MRGLASLLPEYPLESTMVTVLRRFCKLDLVSPVSLSADYSVTMVALPQKFALGV